MRQVFLAGFFHGDPHAGNLFVTANGRICFLDWGLVGHLTRRLRLALADFWIAAVEQDTERIVQIAADLAPVDARPDLRQMEKEVTLTLREELNFSIGRQAIGRAMLRLLFIFGQHGIPLSRDYALMAKAVLSIEEVGRTLNPDFDFRKHAEGVLRELQRERVHPRLLLRNSREMLRHVFMGLQDLPFELRRLLRRLEHDNLAINLHHRGVEDHDDVVKYRRKPHHARRDHRCSVDRVVPDCDHGHRAAFVRLPRARHYRISPLSAARALRGVGIIRHGRHKGAGFRLKPTLFAFAAGRKFFHTRFGRILTLASETRIELKANVQLTAAAVGLFRFAMCFLKFSLCGGRHPSAPLSRASCAASALHDCNGDAGRAF